MEQAAKSFLDILRSYRPESKTVTVQLPCGAALVFRTLGGFSETQKMYEDGARWYASLLEMDGARLEAVGLAGLVPATVEDAAVAYLVSALAVDPPVTPREACVMVAECGDLARFLMSRIEQASKTVDAVRLARLVEDAKKNSPGTRESGDGSS